MELADRISEMVRLTVENLGYSLVRVQVLGQQRPRVQVMAERIDGRPMTVDDCVCLSHSISAVLDVEDPISTTYTLEVSSPGIDRPLVRLADYDRFAGFEARIELARPVGGRRRFRGRLLGTAGETIRLNADGEELEVHYMDIQRAKLVLTEDLLAAHAQPS
jgi:ribosome maturation factor RimP